MRAELSNAVLSFDISRGGADKRSLGVRSKSLIESARWFRLSRRAQADFVEELASMIWLSSVDRDGVLSCKAWSEADHEATKAACRMPEEVDRPSPQLESRRTACLLACSGRWSKPSI